MKRASWRPQQLKEQLLQAVDAQNNIQNMMAALDVICCLERYPMTKEALVETRLGKLINDVRKRSTDEDLVKRLKNLMRRWQRLVGVNEALEKATPSHKASSAPAKHVPRATQTLTENYSQTLFHNNMKHEVAHGSASRKTTNYPTNSRKSKIPILANKLYSSSIKHYTSLGRSLSSQHSQDDHNIINRVQHRSQRQVTSVNTKLHSVVKEPAQSTCITSSIRNSYLNIQQPSDLLNLLKPAAMNVSLAEVSSTVTDTNMRTFEDTVRKNQYNSHTLKLDGRPAEDGTKTTQLPAAKLTHDSPTQQIRSLSNESFAKDCQRSKGNEAQNSEHLKQRLCSFQQANCRETSQTKLIQNTLLTSERSGMDFSMAENFKQEKNNSEECRKPHACIADFPVTDLPGVSREITERDLVRLRSHRWHGVNGCYDNQNNWYDWTQSITLDPYRDGSTFKISPYVGIDYRL